MKSNAKLFQSENDIILLLIFKISLISENMKKLRLDFEQQKEILRNNSKNWKKYLKIQFIGLFKKKEENKI